MKNPARIYHLYDYLQVAGGAERLALTLSCGLPARLVIARHYAAANYITDDSAADIRMLGSWLTKCLGRVPEAIACFLFRSSFLRDADCVIYGGFYAPLAVGRQQRGKKIYYCHTPPRYAFDLRAAYTQRCPLVLRPLLNVCVGAYRWLYKRALQKMDVIVSNSETVRQRLLEHLGLNSIVIHPPITTEKFGWQSDEGYFISLARLEPRKRVNLIIEAFRRMPQHKLVVLSGGSQLEILKQQATGYDNISFTGWQPDIDIAWIIGRARAALYLAADEDFGMSPVEAMAAGKPVIGVCAGGLRETITEQTGWLLSPDPTVAEITAAVENVTAECAAGMRSACEARAAEFSEMVFIEKLRGIVGKA